MLADPHDLGWMSFTGTIHSLHSRTSFTSEMFMDSDDFTIHEHLMRRMARRST
jgi:hypothetical protein